MNNASHLKIDSVSHQFKKGGPVILDNINLQIEPGTSSAIIGRSGCGKSTLVQIACGMVTPSDGKIVIDGAVIRGPSPRWNLMYQEALLFPWMTVFENASLGLRFAGNMKQAPKVVEPLLEMVGLADYAETNVQDLSGGQQQRVALARSLATEPSILFLDEPFSALDAITRRDLQRDVRAIIQEIGITLVLVTHDLDEAISLGDEVVAMTPEPGRVAEVIDTTSANTEADITAIRKKLFSILGDEETPLSASIEQLPQTSESLTGSSGLNETSKRIGGAYA